MYNRIAGIILVYALASLFTISLCVPLLDNLAQNTNIEDSVEESNTTTNHTPKNLYVVKAVVYEIGILTEAGENDTSFESQERVDLSFFDAHTNESHIDLGTIPLPIQTNVSGQVLTGIAPVNIGSFSSPSDLLTALPLTGSIINITHSDTAYYQLKKSSNKNSSENPTFIQDYELSGLSDIADLFGSKQNIAPNNETSSELEKS